MPAGCLLAPPLPLVAAPGQSLSLGTMMPTGCQSSVKGCMGTSRCWGSTEPGFFFKKGSLKIIKWRRATKTPLSQGAALAPGLSGTDEDKARFPLEGSWKELQHTWQEPETSLGYTRLCSGQQQTFLQDTRET